MADRDALAITTATQQFPIAENTKEEVKRAFVSDAAYDAIVGPKRAVSCTILVDAEDTDVSDIHIQLKDRDGNNIAYKAYVKVLCTTTASGTAVNAGSAGIAQHGTPVGFVIGGSVAKGVFECVTSATGALDLIYTDTTQGTAGAFVGVVFDGGYIQWSDNMIHGAT
jgi:hypothetical protein